MKILIVEDDASRIEKFKNGLEKTNELIICENANDGIKQITTNKFDIILLDHDLGNRINVDSMDLNTGYQVALAVKNSPNIDSEFVIHSMNVIGVVNIQNALKEAGCKNIKVIPFCQMLIAK